MPIDARAAEQADALYFGESAACAFRVRSPVGADYGNASVREVFVVRSGERRECLPLSTTAPLSEPAAGLLYAAVALPGSLGVAAVLGELGIAIQ